MCGIVGIANWAVGVPNVDAIQRMSESLVHRGPDDAGLWRADNNQIILGHRRLSIVDLSVHGHQPMHSESGRYVISYNGEIYNLAEIKTELDSAGLAPNWRGHSDTEVLVAAFDAWGIQETLRRTVGMFAIALWNKTKRTLVLARDRLGEKPLYYGIVGTNFLFASELKAIRAGVEGNLPIDRDALANYMRYGYVPAPQSIYVGIRKLLPGHFIEIAGDAELPQAQDYWQRGEAVAHQRYKPLTGSDKELVDELHLRLSDSVRLQMVADVPLGAFLSGGVDSTTIVALMQAHSSRRIRTFTVGFEEKSFDEAPFARAVATYLGTEHAELIVTGKDAIAIIPELPHIYDEPFADSSQMPTTLISRLTRSHVKVALTGDGSDELFGGYPRYDLTEAFWQRASGLPMTLRQGLSTAIGRLSVGGWDQLFSVLPTKVRGRLSGSRMILLSKMLPCATLGEMYVRLMTRWQPEDELVLGVYRPVMDFPLWTDGQSPIASMRLWDLQHYLPDDLMVKVDRAAMNSSLETRAPMLDHRVVEFALSLPENMLLRDGQRKWILRRVLDQYVPRSMMARPKAGFEVPLGDWLRGPLRAWAEDLLEHGRLKREGYLNADKVSHMWRQHLSGKWDRSIHLWNVLMFEAWLEAENKSLS